MDFFWWLMGWTALAMCVGWAAAIKGRRPVTWFGYPWFFLPIAALHVLGAESLQTCPHCQTRVLAKATACPKRTRDLVGAGG